MDERTTIALGEIAELHTTVPVYPEAPCSEVAHRGFTEGWSTTDDMTEQICKMCRPVGHYCQVCGDSGAPVPTNVYACRTSEIVAAILMRDLLGDLPEAAATIAEQTDPVDMVLDDEQQRGGLSGGFCRG